MGIGIQLKPVHSPDMAGFREIVQLDLVFPLRLTDVKVFSVNVFLMKLAHQVVLYFVAVVILVLAGMGMMLNRVYAIDVAHQRLSLESNELKLSMQLLAEIEDLIKVTGSLPDDQLASETYIVRLNRLVMVLEQVRENSVEPQGFEEAFHVQSEKKEFMEIYGEFENFLRTVAMLKSVAPDKEMIVTSKMINELNELLLSGRKLQSVYVNSMVAASAKAERARKQTYYQTIIIFVVFLLLLGFAAGWFIYLINKNTQAMVEQEKGLAIGLLAQSLAHEIRNPLGIIKSSTSVIQKKLLPQTEEYEIAGYLTEEVDRINTLIEQLLQFSKESRMDLMVQDPIGIIEQVLRLMVGVSQKAGVTIDLENKTKGEKVRCDADRIKQALINVILNAVQASRPGDPVTVTARSTPKTYYIEVMDRGLGFKKDALKKAFAQFYTTKDSGLGLGLFMVKKIIDAHGGMVTISPAQPRGTTVIIGLKIEGMS